MIVFCNWLKAIALDLSVVCTGDGSPLPERIGNELLQCELADLGVIVLATGSRSSNASATQPTFRQWSRTLMPGWPAARSTPPTRARSRMQAGTAEASTG